MWTAMTNPIDKKSQRMCVGCGARAEPFDLVRLVVGPSAPFVAVDLGRRLGGRGASVHPKRACIRRSLQRGALANSLRGVAVVEPEAVERMMVRQFDQRVRGLSTSALRTRRLVLGTDAVRGRLAEGEGVLLITAADARGRAADLQKMATSIGCAIGTWGTKAELGVLFSRHELGVFLVTDRGIARAILECLTHIRSLSEGE